MSQMFRGHGWVRGLGLIWGGLLVAAATASSWAADWPSHPKLSGNAFLPPGLTQLQNDTQNSPVTLWLDRGAALWGDGTGGPSCQSCHGAVDTLKNSAGSYPRLVTTQTNRAVGDGKGKGNGNGNSPATLINLEDQIVSCSARGGRAGLKVEDDDLLALSALLANAAKGQVIDVKAPAAQSAPWQARLESGAQLFSTRLGRINLACVHCHDQNIGRQMRLDVISPGNPTGFPIYRMSWQRLGSIERRLRACYSGVQAVLPAPGHADLRDLELFLKVRANGLLMEGPSIRR